MRFNYRDRHLRTIVGINATIWTPYEPARGRITGIALGLPATGAKNIEGVGLGTFGIGAEESLTGIMLGGLGAGAGHDLVGFSLGGIGVGAGNLLNGGHIVGIAVGAPVVRGLMISVVAAGGQDVRAAVFSPLYFKIDEDGYFRGVSVAAYNYIKGEQNGLTIGIFNWTQHLNGVQIGLLNYACNKRKGLRWLPFINVHHD